MKNLNLKENANKVLNGMSIAIIIALLPEAFFGELFKAVGLTSLLPYLAMCTSMLGAVVGVCVAKNFKMDTVATGTLVISAFIAGGALKGTSEEGMLMVKGAGDIINCGLGAVIATVLILNLQDRLGAYKLIALPAITILVTTLICTQTAAPVGQISVAIGNVINRFTEMQPYIMSVLIALSFSLIIVSPLSTVAIALLIQLTMNGAAAATMGVGCMALSMGVLSFKTNGFGTSVAHFMGSPKIQLANVAKNPKIIIPGVVTTLLCSLLVPFFNIQGTPMSAGFGLAGFMGPLGHLNKVGFTMDNVLITALVFIVVPVVTAFVTSYVFKDKLNLVSDEEYKVDIS